MWQMYICQKDKKCLCILCLYIDDMLIVKSDDEMIRFTKNILKFSFDMQDMGLADVILWIKISRTSNRLIFSQLHYVDKILGKFNKDDFAVARTPLDTSLYLFKNRGEGVSQVEYFRVISSLMYPSNCTRLDLAYTVNKLQIYE